MDGPAKKAPAYNLNNPAVKRLLKEYRELQKEGSDQYTAAPLEEDIFEFHFTIRGPSGTDFEGGVYHGRILLPQEYPMKPPDFVFLTPNGRFEVGKKICLTVTSYHSESWQPSWSIRTALLAIIGFMPTKAEGAIGGLDYSADERKKLAAQSTSWRCDKCGAHCARALPDAPTPQPSLSSSANSLAASADDLRTSGPALRVSQVSYTIPQSPTQPGSASPTAPPSTPAAAAPTPLPPSSAAAAPAVMPPPRPASPVPSAARLPGAAAMPPQAQLAVAPQRQESKFLDTAIGFLIAMIIALLWHKYRGV